MDSLPVSLKPDVIKRKKTKFNTTTKVFENGREQRFINWKTGKKRYELSWNVIDATKLAELDTFFSNQGGMAKQWLFADTRIGGTRYVRFDSDELTVEPINAQFFNVSIEVMEC